MASRFQKESQTSLRLLLVGPATSSSELLFEAVRRHLPDVRTDAVTSYASAVEKLMQEHYDAAVWAGMASIRFLRGSQKPRDPHVVCLIDQHAIEPDDEPLLQTLAHVSTTNDGERVLGAIEQAINRVSLFRRLQQVNRESVRAAHDRRSDF